MSISERARSGYKKVREKMSDRFGTEVLRNRLSDLIDRLPQDEILLSYEHFVEAFGPAIDTVNRVVHQEGRERYGSYFVKREDEHVDDGRVKKFVARFSPFRRGYTQIKSSLHGHRSAESSYFELWNVDGQLSGLAVEIDEEGKRDRFRLNPGSGLDEIRGFAKVFRKRVSDLIGRKNS